MTLLGVMFLSRGYGEWFRTRAAALARPIWEGVAHLSAWFAHPFSHQLLLTQRETIERLHRENLCLKTRCADDLDQCGQVYLARVLFRSLDQWNRRLWIDRGGEHGVKKNMPVVSDGAAVGIVDLVGEREARVALITDPRTVVSVRAVRGEQVDLIAQFYLEKLQERLGSSAEAAALRQSIERYHGVHNVCLKKMFLAKGELTGELSDAPMGRFRGTGFNYDFSDARGSAKDLLLGVPTPSGSLIPLVAAGDLLETTGYDGVFPEGIPVARVTLVEPIKEGEYFYEIRAESLLRFDEIAHVSLLNPVMNGIPPR